MSIENTSSGLTKEVVYNQLITLKHFLKTRHQFIPFFLLIIFLILPLNLFILKHLKHSFSQFTQTEKMPLLTWGKLMDGSFQREYEVWFNETNLMRSMFTKLNNQFYYSFFSRSLMYNSNIIIGKKNYLYEKVYIDQYVNPGKIIYNQNAFDHWAANLQELADFFAKRGQKLIYVMTPSKATFYPEFLPKDYAKLIHNPRPDYFLKKNALNKIHVPYFDASQFLLEEKKKPHGKLLFSRGGTHWTSLGAGLAAQKILDLISQETQTPQPPLSFTYEISTTPLGVDQDLLHLCKLIFPPEKYLVPHVSFKANKNPSPLKVAIIGGSFTHFFKEAFGDSHTFSQLDHYYYLILHHVQITKEGQQVLIPLNRNDPVSYQAILSADVVILEENEILPYSNHFRELYFQLLGKYPS